MQNKPIERLTISLTEAGEAIGLGRAAAYEAAKRGEIPTIKVGRRVLVPVAALKEKFSASAR